MSKKFVGTTIDSLKKYPELLPVWGCIIGGMSLASWYLFRLATKNPEVSWTRKNPEPWNEYAEKQYKFFSPVDKPPSSPAPKY